MDDNQIETHQYFLGVAGSYTATLRVTDNAGLIDTDQVVITATTTPITYTLTIYVNPPGAGTVTLNPAGGTYNAGIMVTLKATANSGYTFSSWSRVDSSSGTTAYVIMNGNRTVDGQFFW